MINGHYGATAELPCPLQCLDMYLSSFCVCTWLGKAKTLCRGCLPQRAHWAEQRVSTCERCTLSLFLFQRAVALNAALCHGRCRWTRKPAGKLQQRESVLLNQYGSLHRRPIDFRRMFSSSARRVGDRRSADAAVSLDAATPERDFESVLPEGLGLVEAIPEHASSVRGSLQHAETSSMSNLMEQLAHMSKAEEVQELKQPRTPSPTRLPETLPSLDSGSMPRIALAPSRKSLSRQGSMNPLALSPSRQDGSVQPIAHENVEIGLPSTEDALKEVHAEIMDKGLPMLPSESSQRGSLSGHSSELHSRRGFRASPQRGGGEDRPQTLAQSWARISRPPLARRGGSERRAAAHPGSAAGSPVARPRGRSPLQPWSSMPSRAGQPLPLQKPLQPPTSAVAPGKQITPSSPEWVPSPFDGSARPEGVHWGPVGGSPGPPATNVASLETSGESQRPPIVRHSSGPALTASSSADRRSLDSRIGTQPGSGLAPVATDGGAGRARGRGLTTRHSSARGDMLQRTAQALLRGSARQEDLQGIMQVLWGHLHHPQSTACSTHDRLESTMYCQMASFTSFMTTLLSSPSP